MDKQMMIEALNAGLEAIRAKLPTSTVDAEIETNLTIADIREAMADICMLNICQDCGALAEESCYDSRDTDTEVYYSRCDKCGSKAAKFQRDMDATYDSLREVW